MGRKFHDLTGLRSGRLTVIERGPDRSNRATWICQCDCGNTTQAWAYNLARGKKKSCGCLSGLGRPKTKSANSKRIRSGKGKQWVRSQASAMKAHKNGYMQGAAQRNLKWQLTDAQFEELVKTNCFYCGVEPENNGHYLGAFNGIDRIDSSKDYTWDNCVPCCKTCNYAKQSLHRDDFIQWIGRAFVHLHKQGLLELEVENA